MRWWPGASAAWLLAALLLVGCATAPPREAAPWVAAWGSAQLALEPAVPANTPGGTSAAPAWREPFADVSLRQVLRVSAPGPQLRVRVSNVLGKTALHIGAASVALAEAAAPAAEPVPPRLRAGTMKPLLFGGARALVVQPGAEVWSDPVALPLRRFDDLVVNLHVQQGVAPATAHPGSRIHSWAAPGNRVDEADWPGAAPRIGWWHLGAVDVRGAAPTAVLVAIGDSITDGYGVAPGSHQRWTDFLARRLEAAGRDVAVVNTGIGGNRLLRDGLGPNLLARFERDVVERSGVTHAVLLIGVNDLGTQRRAKEDSAANRARLLADLQQGLQRLATRARERNVCLIAATVLPYSSSGYYSPGPDNEADRRALNAWLREAAARGTFAALADFDAALRDPQRPEHLAPAYDSGDGLHPSMAGYRAMAEAFPLAALGPCTPAATTMPSTYPNPVLSGFAADPSVCRMGDDYYLATSSFEYFPGVPIHHSRDLVHWRLIGHALTRESQLPLAGRKSSKGIFAPTLRCERGVFYMVTTNVEGGGNFFVHTRDPAGEWSEPVWLPEPVFGMDPSFFFDDDGRVYYTRHGGLERGGAYQAEVDIQAGRLLAEPKLIWRGTGGIWPEGPHLYKREGWYYLLISEGGTSYGHSLTMARSRSPWGPFEPHPDNPILTHRDRPQETLQALGHADMVQTPAGDWWAVLLGIRAHEHEGKRHHHLGRETLLTPVRWRSDGWPVFNRGQPLLTAQPTEGLPGWAPWPAEPVRETFAPGRPLPLHWASVRAPLKAQASLAARPGWLRLNGSATTLEAIGTPTFLGRRQRHLHQRVATQLDYAPTHADEAAGLALRQNEDHHLLLQVVQRQQHGQRRVQCVQRSRGSTTVLAEAPLPPGAVELQVHAQQQRYALAWRSAGSAAWQPLCETPTALLSSETTGGFTGVFIGPYATSGRAGASAAPADFAWLEFERLGD